MHLWKENLIFDSHDNALNDSLPRAPHLVDCKAQATLYEQFDNRNVFEERPKWSLWKGHLRLHSSWHNNEEIEDKESLLGHNERLIMGPYPPWVFSLRLYEFISILVTSFN